MMLTFDGRCTAATNYLVMLHGLKLLLLLREIRRGLVVVYQRLVFFIDRRRGDDSGEHTHAITGLTLPWHRCVYRYPTHNLPRLLLRPMTVIRRFEARRNVEVGLRACGGRLRAECWGTGMMGARGVGWRLWVSTR